MWISMKSLPGFDAPTANMAETSRTFGDLGRLHSLPEQA